MFPGSYVYSCAHIKGGTPNRMVLTNIDKIYIMDYTTNAGLPTNKIFDIDVFISSGNKYKL